MWHLPYSRSHLFRTMRRVLSFGRAPKRAAAPGGGAAATVAEAGPAAQATANPPPEAKRESKLSGKSIRRNLSFRRTKPQQPPQPPPAAAAAAAAVSSSTAEAPTTPPSRQPASPKSSIRRTISWQRGHRQAARIKTAATAASRGRGLGAASPALMSQFPPPLRALMGQVRARVWRAPRSCSRAQLGAPPQVWPTRRPDSIATMNASPV